MCNFKNSFAFKKVYLLQDSLLGIHFVIYPRLVDSKSTVFCLECNIENEIDIMDVDGIGVREEPVGCEDSECEEVEDEISEQYGDDGEMVGREPVWASVV